MALNWKRMMAATVIGGTGPASLAQEPDVSTWLPKWSYDTALRTGGGYRDNATFSHFAPQGAAFVLGGLDLGIMRLPLDGPQVDILLSGEDRRFFGVTNLETELLAMADAQVTKFWSAHWRTGLGLEYSYQDQILDLSVSETNLVAAAARGHTLTARPMARWDWTGQEWFELQFAIERQFFGAPLDDYWVGGPRLTLGHSYGYNSDVTVTYELMRGEAEHIPQLDSSGLPVPGTHRSYTRQDVLWLWRHYWDEPQHWRVTTKLSFRRNDDEGSGYFSYFRWQVSGQLRYRRKGWEASTQVKLADYHYDVQTASATDPSKRRRREIVANARVQKKLVKFLSLFAEYEREQTFSNLGLDEYTVNTVSGGLQWEF